MPRATRGFTPWSRAASDVNREHKQVIRDIPCALALSVLRWLQHVRLGFIAPLLLAGRHVTNWTRLHPSAVSTIPRIVRSISSSRSTGTAPTLPPCLPTFISIFSFPGPSMQLSLLRAAALNAARKAAAATGEDEIGRPCTISLSPNLHIQVFFFLDLQCNYPSSELLDYTREE